MSDERSDILRYRVERAFETLQEAKTLAEISSWKGVANRLYYACFYMASALLLKKGLYSKTHAGTKTLFQQEFIKTGLMAQSFGMLYQQLFHLRQESDYEDLIQLEDKEVNPLIP